MRLEARKYLRDIRVALERIERFTKGKRFEQYLADDLPARRGFFREAANATCVASGLAVE